MSGSGLKFFDAGKFRMTYREFGRSAEKTAVLLHGFCGSSEYWRYVWPELALHFRVIVPDLRGHGASGLPEDEPSTMENLADDIADLIRHLNGGPAVVLGHSLGGYVTLALYERHPALCRAIGLVHSTPLPDTPEAKENRLAGISAIRENGIRPYVDNLIPKLFSPVHIAERQAAVSEALRIGYAASPEGACRVLEGMRLRPDRRSVLERARVPVLLVAGSDDQIVPPERSFAADGPHIVKKTIETAGHMSMMEVPGRCAETLVSFIRSA